MTATRETGAYLHDTPGGATWYGNSFWSHPWYVRGVICADGKRRTVRLNEAPDTYFSYPGRASIGGRTVRGFVHTDDQDTYFTVYTGA